MEIFTLLDGVIMIFSHSDWK